MYVSAAISVANPIKVVSSFILLVANSPTHTMHLHNIPPLGSIFGGLISDLVAKGQNLKEPLCIALGMEKGGLSSRLSRARFGPPYWQRCRRPSSPRNQVPGCRQSRCGGHIRRRRTARWRSRRRCRPRRRRRRLRHRRARSRCRIVPAVVAVMPAAVRVRSRRPDLWMIGLALVAAGVGISRSLVLAIGVWIELRAIAGIGDHLLRHGGACERRGEDRGGAEILIFVMRFLRFDGARNQPMDAKAEVPISGCANFKPV